ncbi:MAG TPA: hypothetical protein VFR58_18710 [Flavisolibacter sp.]|nr:hypothetical protein [Flavisolibacter sp.]
MQLLLRISLLLGMLLAFRLPAFVQFSDSAFTQGMAIERVYVHFDRPV